MTRDKNSHKIIEIVKLEEILSTLKEETILEKDNEEFLLNILCVFSNLAYTNFFHEWFIHSDMIEHILNHIVQNSQVAKIPKIRGVLVTLLKTLIFNYIYYGI